MTIGTLLIPRRLQEEGKTSIERAAYNGNHYCKDHSSTGGETTPCCSCRLLLLSSSLSATAAMDIIIMATVLLRIHAARSMLWSCDGNGGGDSHGWPDWWMDGWIHSCYRSDDRMGDWFIQWFDSLDSIHSMIEFDDGWIHSLEWTEETKRDDTTTTTRRTAQRDLGTNCCFAGLVVVSDGKKVLLV